MSMSEIKRVEIGADANHNKVSKVVNQGTYDKNVVRDIFDVLVKHEVSYELAVAILGRSIYLTYKQMDESKIKPLELVEKSK